MTARAALAAVVLAAACVRAPAPAPSPSLPPLRVGTSGDYAPFSIERAGELRGFDLEVADRFARDTGRRLRFVRFRWPDLLRDLEAGRFDLAMSGVTMRPERAVVGTFTRPVAETGAVVVTRTGIASRPEDLDRPGMRIAVNAGGHLEHVARRYFPAAAVMPVEDNLSLRRVLDGGAVEAVLTDALEAPHLFGAMPGMVRLGPLTRDRKAYLGRDAALVAELDAWLRQREIDGTLAELRGQWLGPQHGRRPSAFEADMEALLALVDLRLAFMPSVAAAKEAAGRPVRDARQEVRVIAAARERAEALGLDPDTVGALFRAQIAAARAAQEAFVATPPARRAPVMALDLARMREALGRLSDALIGRAAAVADHAEDLARSDPAAVAHALDPTLSPPTGREAIAGAVVGLRLAPDQSL